MKYLVITLFVLSTLFADQKQIVTSFLSTYSALKPNKTLFKILKKDPYYKKGICCMFSKKCFKIGKIEAYDPEAEEKEEEYEKQGIPYHPKMIKALVPDYKRALEEFAKSAKIYKNPISAYEGLYIIRNLYQPKGVQKYILIRNLSKTLYKYSNSCEGFLSYANVFEKGIATPPNIINALRIYSEGMDTCNKKIYYSLLFKSAIMRLKKILQKGKK